MTAVYLRLAAPLQSWAGPRLTGNVVTTEALPPRRSLIGLLAACLGAPRDEFPNWLSEIEIEVRVDNPGQVISEFQTINPREEDLDFQQRIHLALTGKSWTHQAHLTPDAQRGLDKGRFKGTSIVRRTYISGGEFLLSLTHPTRVPEIWEAIRSPVFSPYLGKKAFPPTAPFILGMGQTGLLREAIPVFESETALTGVSYFDDVDTEQNDGIKTKSLRLYRYAPSGEVTWELSQVAIAPKRSQWSDTVRELLQIRFPATG